MDSKYEALFTPWKIGNVEIKNRIVMCPMGGTSLFGWFELGGCHFDKEAAKLFLERAQNNVGLIIPGIAPLRDTFWGKWLWQNPKMFEELKVFMEEIHATGAKLFVQLTAGMGRSWAITELVGLQADCLMFNWYHSEMSSFEHQTAGTRRRRAKCNPLNFCAVISK